MLGGSLWHVIRGGGPLWHVIRGGGPLWHTIRGVGLGLTYLSTLRPNPPCG